jgi:hypothetical protein
MAAQTNRLPRPSGHRKLTEEKEQCALPPYELWQITTHRRANPTHTLGHAFAFDDNAVRAADKLDERLVVPAGRRFPFPLVPQIGRPQQRPAASDFARFQLLLSRRGETITGLAAKTLMGRSHVSQVLHNRPAKSRHKLRRVLTAEELTALGWQQNAPADFEI